MFCGFGRDQRKRNKADKISPVTLLRLARKLFDKCKLRNIRNINILTKVSIRYAIIVFLNELRYLVCLQQKYDRMYLLSIMFTKEKN